MKKSIIVFFLLLVFYNLCGAQSSQKGCEDFSQYKKFDEAQLQAVLIPEKETDHYIRYLIKYRSDKDWVWGTYFLPKHVSAPVAAVIGVHGIWSPYREQFWSSAELMVEQGYAVLLPSLPYHHQRKSKYYILSGQPFINYDLPQTRQNFYQAIVDLRRGLDWLLTRPEIDRTRIGVVGASLGGIITSLLLKVEPRISVGVLLVAGGDIKETIVYSRTYVVRFLRFGLDLHIYNIEDMVREWQPMDPSNYSSTAQPILMINGVNDIIFSVKNVQKLYNTWNNVKILWTTSGHQIPEIFAQYQMLAFFKQKLRYRPEIPYTQGLSLINIHLSGLRDDDSYFGASLLYHTQNGLVRQVMNIPLINTRIVDNKIPLVFISKDEKLEETEPKMREAKVAYILLQTDSTQEIFNLLDILLPQPWVDADNLYYFKNDFNKINYPGCYIKPGKPTKWLESGQKTVKIELDPVW